jgi:hypothetical protein
MKKIFLALISYCLLSNINAQLPKIFNPQEQPKAPDYSNSNSWISLPFRKDGADITPKYEEWISDSLKNVDVFFIYPTIYAKGKTWNADIYDEKLNKKIDNTTIKFQASVFNQVGRVYAPRYRQGIIDCFYDTSEAGKKSLDFAYQDVKKAFEYYMKYYNNGRPIIIASHSQGTRHARLLLKEYFDTPAMKEKLVCAYVVGYGIYPSTYSILKPCEDAQQTNCYVTWSSFKNNYIPNNDTLLWARSCVNPISWKCDTMPSSCKSGIFLNINKKKGYETTAQIHNNYLWVKTKVPFMPFFKVMHLLDYNLYWSSIRKNVKERVDEYLSKRK